MNAVRIPTSAEHKAACAATYARIQLDTDDLDAVLEVMHAGANAAHLSRGYVPEPEAPKVSEARAIAYFVAAVVVVYVIKFFWGLV
jgi:hypothetical protein